MILLMSMTPQVTVAIYERWPNGPSSDPQYFPIGVWLQDPGLAPRYQAAGINFYMGLWRGPTVEQLALLRYHGMRVICTLNETARRYLDDPVIMGWLQADEPDNAQRNDDGSWGPPTPPEEVIKNYERLRSIDPTRPVFLNLGQGVANDEWVGRGPGASVDDYPEYCRGADVISFDVYPISGLRRDDGEEYLWYVAKGLKRLRQWAGEDKIIWTILETTRIDTPKKVTPHQLRAQVWMSLIHGSRGIVYFVHEWYPKFNAAALLSDKEMLAAVTEINRRISALAPVLNSPNVEGVVEGHSVNPDIPIATMVKQDDEYTYVFAVGMRNAPTTGVFGGPGLREGQKVEVMYEDRVLEVKDGKFTDEYKAYDSRLYRFKRRAE